MEVPVPEMQKAMARLRFLLAAIKGKEQELESLSQQFQRQLSRAPNYAIHGGNSLEATLSIMNEVQERLDSVEKMRRHLAAIKMRAQDELQALELTEKIEHAKSELAALKARQKTDELSKEIEGLERFIKEASIRAGQAITGRAFEAGDRNPQRRGAPGSSE